MLVIQYFSHYLSRCAIEDGSAKWYRSGDSAVEVDSVEVMRIDILHVCVYVYECVYKCVCLSDLPNVHDGQGIMKKCVCVCVRERDCNTTYLRKCVMGNDETHLPYLSVHIHIRV